MTVLWGRLKTSGWCTKKSQAPSEAVEWAAVSRTSAGNTGTSMYFTAEILLPAHGSRTKYPAIVKHGDAATAKRHEEMGFYQGWGTTLDQLVALVRSW
jgi:uncharacterized protein YndB with AHSA1/START domain